MLGSDLLGSSQALKSVTSFYNDTIMAVMTGKLTKKKYVNTCETLKWKAFHLFA